MVEAESDTGNTSSRSSRPFEAANLLVDRVPLFVASLDRNEVFEYANAYYARLGVDPASLIGKTMQSVLGDPLYAKTRHHAHLALRGEEVGFEIQHPGLGGGIRWFRGRYLPRWNDFGEIDGFHSVVYDITETKRVGSELDRQREELRAILDAAGDGILAVDRKGRLKSFNRSSEALWGMDRQAALRRSWRELFGSRTTLRIERAMEGCRPDRPMRGEGNLTQKDGGLRAVEWVVTRPKRTDVLVIVVRDLSERRELEREVYRAGEEERERIASDLHDGLGSLLTGTEFRLGGLTSRLRDAGIGEEEMRNLEEISAGIRSAVSMCRRLAHGLHLGGGSQGDYRESFRKMFDDILSDRGIESEIAIAKDFDFPSGVLASQLLRIAQECVLNSVKHSGCSRIRFEMGRNEAGDLEMTVSDDGVGLEKNHSEETPGIGLRIMEYRAHTIEADLQLRSDDGTSIRCVVPARIAFQNSE